MDFWITFTQQIKYLTDYIEEVVNKEINQDNEANDVLDRNTYGIAGSSRSGENPYGITGSSKERASSSKNISKNAPKTKNGRKEQVNDSDRKKKRDKKTKRKTERVKEKGKVRALSETSSSSDSDDFEDSNFKNLTSSNSDNDDSEDSNFKNLSSENQSNFSEDVARIYFKKQDMPKNLRRFAESIIYQIIHALHRHRREGFLKKDKSLAYNKEQDKRKHSNVRRYDVSFLNIIIK
ncbi:hypothetical protein GLOIN_2v1845756 [Rhizophagus clarus]|uniref:Uncharacterized protein n=1 Tax=Rhizophagus clarus TaxID=94130 RepID=A0A8H3M1H9_9GLOM|nr:hypothetical protein GLOIN_2v1845756 [Rhizophagus clarus]